jgi:hypothetical protein
MLSTHAYSCPSPNSVTERVSGGPPPDPKTRFNVRMFHALNCKGGRTTSIVQINQNPGLKVPRSDSVMQACQAVGCPGNVAEVINFTHSHCSNCPIKFGGFPDTTTIRTFGGNAATGVLVLYFNQHTKQYLCFPTGKIQGIKMAPVSPGFRLDSTGGFFMRLPFVIDSSKTWTTVVAVSQ